jgi:hypothetical protein
MLTIAFQRGAKSNDPLLEMLLDCTAIHNSSDGNHGLESVVEMSNFHNVNIRNEDFDKLEVLRKKWGERSIAATVARLVKEK